MVIDPSNEDMQAVLDLDKYSANTTNMPITISNIILALAVLGFVIK
ncbi:hypothetical protein [Pedobacter borealis]|nr:hypothetical protein [Pedobacter borealis]